MPDASRLHLPKVVYRMTYETWRAVQAPSPMTPPRYPNPGCTPLKKLPVATSVSAGELLEVVGGADALQGQRTCTVPMCDEHVEVVRTSVRPTCCSTPRCCR